MKRRNARIGHNPRTGEEVPVDAKTADQQDTQLNGVLSGLGMTAETEVTT